MLSVAPSSNGRYLDSLMFKGRGSRFAAQTDEEEKGDTVGEAEEGEEEEGEEEEGEEGKLKASMIKAIKWYRNTLSPIMPPNCRFLPTCSNYGIEAIQTYGSWKGGLLTAWRIFRCNPFGGAGYDPPTWPPVAFRGGSRYQRKK